MKQGNGIERLKVKEIESWLKNPGDGPVKKLSDGGGLVLVRLPSGRASWQIKYSYNGAERTFSVGSADAVTLEFARAERRRVKDLVKAGTDPVQVRRVEKAEEIASAGHLFGDVAQAWLAKERAGWSEVHFDRSSKAIHRDVLPTLGALPVREITPAMVSRVIEKIQRRGVRETAAKVLQHVRSIFRYAAAMGMRDDNPADAAIEVLQRPDPVKHHPALLALPELGDVLRRAEAASISPAVRLAHRLVAFTAVRIANAVAAKWTEFDFGASPARWTIPRDQMKVRGRDHDHVVLLPGQIADALKRWRTVQPEDAEYVFPGTQGREHLSRESVEKALRVTLALAGKHSPHGWRSAFSTLARELGEFENELVDLCLDHVHASDVARAYDRGQRLERRKAVMAWWGTQLEQAERGGDVVPIRGAA